MTSNPTIGQFAMQAGSYLVIVLFVYALSKILRVRLKGWSFENPRRSGLWGLAAIFVTFLLASALLLPAMGHPDRSANNPVEAQGTYTADSAVNQTILCFIMILPVLIVKKVRRESWESLGVTRRNLSKAITIGFLLAILGAVMMLIASGIHFATISRALTASHFWAFILYAAVGFSEELIYRGYLQIRLIVWLGRLQGWFAASVIMAMFHFAQRSAVMGMNVPDALLSCIGLIPISLLLGYIMMRTENIVAPAIYHTFANWYGTLLL